MSTQQQPRYRRYNHLDPEMNAVVNAVVHGRAPLNDPKYQIVDRTFFSIVQYANAGQRQLTFFAGSVSDGIQNLGSELQSNMAFVLRGVGIKLRTGVTMAGAADAAGAQIRSHATAFAGIVLAEEIRAILQNGLFRLRVADFLVSEGFCTSYPEGNDVTVNGDISTNSATTQVVTSQLVTNGPPVGNGKTIMPYVIPPSERINATIDWLTALPITTAIGAMKVELRGQLVTKNAR